MPNTSNDDDTRYRSREEVETWKQRDPIARLRAHLISSEAASDTSLGALEAEVEREIEDAATWAEAQPDAQPEDALLHTWADGPVSAPTWMRA
jgi:TPP-dependent pyruvate/acetoin dehydrogenase alpha subunit